MLGVLALLLMHSVPVFAQKAILNQAGKVSFKTTTKEMVTKQKTFSPKHFENGKLILKTQVLDETMKFANFTNLLNANTMKVVSPMKPMRVAASQDEAIVPPFAETWDGTNDEYYDIIDANGDGSTWSINTDKNRAEYNFNSAHAADDWFLSPKFLLEAGSMYKFEAMLSCAHSSYPERIEILAGQGDDPTTYTITLLEATTIGDRNAVSYKASLIPTESGEYRIGFHAISDVNQYRLSINGWNLSGPEATTVPGEVTNLQVDYAEGGALNAVVGFTAPSVDAGGKTLESITKIEISCGDIVETIENVEPGSEQSVNVAVPTSGVYTFNVTAYNENGAGETVSASAFIGMDSPTVVANVIAIDNKNGTVTFSWDEYAEETGANGGYLDLSTLKYNIYGLDENGNTTDLIATVTEPTYTMACPEWNQGAHRFFHGVVAPVVNGNEGGLNYANILIGESDAIPYTENFADAAFSNYWWTNTYYGHTNWGLTNDLGADGEIGCAYFYPSEMASTAAGLNTGKISVKGATAPVLTFLYNNFSKGIYKSNVTLWVRVDRQNGVEPVVVYQSTGEEGEDIWNEAVVNLSDYVNDDYIIVSFIAIGEDYQPVLLLDNIHIKDANKEDIAVELEAPTLVNIGDDIEVSATVTNKFMDRVSAGSYSVVFTANGKEFANITDTDELDALTGTATFTATYSPDLFDVPNVNVKAEVVYSPDTNLENNVAEANVSVLGNELPTIDDLSGVLEDGIVTLRWSAPEAFTTVTENFENGQGAFTIIDANNDGFGWTFTNADGNKTKSGKGVMTSISYDNPTRTPIRPDDWFVTPQVKLTGNFSFYACGQDAKFAAEHFAVYVSTTGNDDPADFTLVSEEFEATDVMTKYTVDLSSYKGVAGYVAIRHFNCYDMFHLNVDDVTYTPLDAQPLEIVGYNVYRDGELIGTATDTEYVDEVDEDGKYTYNVTALFGDAETNISNDCEITVGGWLPGDVNHDGRVSVSDVQAVVAYILGNTPDLFYPTEGNLNGDGDISVADVTLIVNIILGL